MQRGRARAGVRLVIHAVAGGVGLKALEYTQWLSGSALGSCGRPQKHGQLRSLGAQLCSSRDAAAFACGALRYLSACRVHGALNSLSLDFITTAFASLAEGSAFAEIGKRGVWSAQNHVACSPRAQYNVIALDADMSANPAWMSATLCILARRADVSSVSSLPLRSFDLETQVEAAFRTMQSGLNTGKIVVHLVAARGEWRRG